MGRLAAMAVLVLGCGAPVAAPIVASVEPAVEPPREDSPRELGATIALSERRACAIDEARRVVCWGGGEVDLAGPEHQPQGPTRLPGFEDAVELALGGEYEVCVRTSAGHLECAAFDDCPVGEACPPLLRGPPRRVEGVQRARAFALGRYNELAGCAIDDRGEVRCWQSDEHGGPYRLRTAAVPRARAIGIASASVCSIAFDGAVACGDAALGAYDHEGARLAVYGFIVCAWAPGVAPACWSLREGVQPPRDLAPSRAFAPTGSTSACTIDEAGALACGGRSFEEAGLVELAAIHDVVCVRRPNGDVACAGSNQRGQLGTTPVLTVDAPRRVEGLPPVRQVRASGGRVCALSVAGEAFCWGGESLGSIRPLVGGTDLSELVVRQSFHSSPRTPTETTVAAIGADGRVRLWRGVRAPPVVLEGVDDAEGSIAVGERWVAARRRGGAVATWASEDAAPVVRRIAGGARALAPTPAGACALRRDGRLDCAARADLSPDVDGYSRWRRIEEIASNGGTLCARTGSRLRCHTPSEGDRVLDASESFDHLAVGDERVACAIATDRVVCSRYPMTALIALSTDAPPFALVPVADTEGAVEVAVGYHFACARMSDGEVRCWGNNTYGSVGIDHASSELVDIPLDAEP